MHTLPQELWPFEKATLIVVTDRMHARVFLAQQRSLGEMNEFHTNEFPLKDTHNKTRASQTGGGMGDSMEDEHIKERVGEHFFKDIAQFLHKALQAGEYDQVALVVGHEHKNELVDTLHHDVKERVCCVVPKLLIKESPITITKAVQKEMGPQ